MSILRFSFILYSLLIHTVFSINSFGSDSTLESKQRSFETFVKENTGTSAERILIIGGGHQVNESYPKNYFLIDILETQKPDLQTDICTPISEELHGKFDVVILEHLPMNCIPRAMNNVNKLLKSQGKLIFNNICTVAINSSTSQYDSASEILSEDIKYYSLSHDQAYTHEKVAFRMYCNPVSKPKLNYNQILERCTSHVLNPYLEKFDFGPVEILTPIPYMTTFQPSQTILLSIKK